TANDLDQPRNKGGLWNPLVLSPVGCLARLGTLPQQNRTSRCETLKVELDFLLGLVFDDEPGGSWWNCDLAFVSVFLGVDSEEHVGLLEVFSVVVLDRPVAGLVDDGYCKRPLGSDAE